MTTDDRTQIHTLIQRWAEAVHAGDMDGVLADRADDIVMFDVPPPHEGVRGIGAYRDTWPPFFAWQAGGAVFEITELEVTAGEDVAFAHALLRCGTPRDLERDPANRLRLTIGLRKENGRWVVAHEHHSFALAGEGGADEEIRKVHQGWFGATEAKDLDGIMAHIADDVVSYEHNEPLEYVGADAVREVCAEGLQAATGIVQWDVPDLRILSREDLAVAWGLNRVRVEGAPDVWSRGTRVFQRIDGVWTMVHQHVSFPSDSRTGAARTDLPPARPDRPDSP
ncbi:nuclear transport factor 2 family protein [Actinomadura sp. WMMA1423]|uniref:YybH family protein n=1 Tax=Actinomadura sp. WMMA1423 TaxID=2591108 RepID=UPI001147135A|nr:nuclear transport factor 2 family protein [Actinomadura sp. WMMA1423]